MPLGRKVPSSAVPAGQAESNGKKSLTEGPIYIEDGEPSKRARVQDLPSACYSDDDKFDLIDDDLAPHSRWQASEELTAFIGATRKPLLRFERRALVKTFPRPNIDETRTPTLDDYLKPMLQGLKSPD